MDTPSSVSPASANGGMFSGSSPKLTFWFGVIAGVAVSSIIGILLLVNNKSAGSGSTNTATTSVPTNSNTNTATNPAGPIKAVSSADYKQGKGKLYLVEYSDLECPYCKNFHPTMLQIMKDYAGQVQWVYRNYPLSFHANAGKEAEAALCVGNLGGNDKYWSFIDKIYERTTSNGTGFALTALGPLAKEVGVNQQKFQDCLDSGKMAATVAAEQADGSAGGVNGTPTTFLVDSSGKVISSLPGAYDLASVKAQIDAALKTL